MKKKSDRKPKLSLSRETLRALSEPKLEQLLVDGGTGTTHGTWCCSERCTNPSCWC